MINVSVYDETAEVLDRKATEMDVSIAEVIEMLIAHIDEID